MLISLEFRLVRSLLELQSRPSGKGHCPAGAGIRGEAVRLALALCGHCMLEPTVAAEIKHCCQDEDSWRW